MALSSKASGVARQTTICRNVVSTIPTPTHLFNAMRCVGFVSWAQKPMIDESNVSYQGLAYVTDDQAIKKAFENFGEVTEAKVITDRMTGKSRGFGFVGYTTDESASQALSSMDGQELHGRNIRVSFANKKPGGEFRGADDSNQVDH